MPTIYGGAASVEIEVKISNNFLRKLKKVKLGPVYTHELYTYWSYIPTGFHTIRNKQ